MRNAQIGCPENQLSSFFHSSLQFSVIFRFSLKRTPSDRHVQEEIRFISRAVAVGSADVSQVLCFIVSINAHSRVETYITLCAPSSIGYNKKCGVQHNLTEKQNSQIRNNFDECNSVTPAPSFSLMYVSCSLLCEKRGIHPISFYLLFFFPYFISNQINGSVPLL